MKKKILMLVIILVIIIPLSTIMFPVIRNDNYKKSILNNIYNNTGYKNIKYFNKDNNYYIIKTENKVLVLDLNYEEKLSINIDKLKDNNLELVYRRNNLYYEKKIKNGSKLIYKFYNVETNELEYETSLGGI